MKKNSVKDFRNWATKEFDLEVLPRIQELIVLDALAARKKQELDQLRNSSNFLNLDEEKSLNKLYQNMFNEGLIQRFQKQVLIICLGILIVLVCFFYWNPMKSSRKFSLVFALPNDRSSRRNTNELHEFFLEERLPLKKQTTIIIQNNRFNFLPQKLKLLKLVFRAEFFLISRMGLSSRLSVLSLFLRNFALMFQRKRITTALRLSYRQFLLEIPVSTVAIRRNMLDWVATTNSSYLKQHSIFYLATDTNLPSYMFWYSENSSLVLFGGEFDTLDYEQFRDIAVKEHLVWTQEFANFLKKFTSSKITCIGSILFYPRRKYLNHTKDIDVLIFDVTPFASATEQDFYNYERCTRFLDMLLCFQERFITRKIVMAIKIKRKFSSLHDTHYVSKVLDCKSDPYNWKFLNPEVNLYNLIARSKLVVGIPFTSAVLIAKEFAVPCCYLIDSYISGFPDTFNGVPVIQKLDDLENLFLKC